MSASTRTVQQQALGTNPLGAALAVVALIIIVAAAIAFGSLGAAKPAVTPAGPAGLPAIGYDHSVDTTTGAKGLPTVGYDNTNGYAGSSSTDVHGGNPKNPVNVGTKRPGLRPD